MRKKCDKISLYIEAIKTKTIEILKDDIIKKTNEKLSEIITDDLVQIESIDKYLRLIKKTGASEGQTLSVAYCYLGTLFEDSELNFPFIIDSPAGKIDHVRRRNIADKVPSLFHQMIAFVISTEVDGFADRFYTGMKEQPNSLPL